MRKHLLSGILAAGFFISWNAYAAGEDKNPNSTEVLSSYSSPEGDYDALYVAQDALLAVKEGNVGVGLPASEAEAKLAVAGNIQTKDAVVESGADVQNTLTVSGLLDAQGGLIIQKLREDPKDLTSADDGRLWLVSSSSD